MRRSGAVRHGEAWSVVADGGGEARSGPVWSGLGSRDGLARCGPDCRIGSARLGPAGFVVAGGGGVVGGGGS